MGAKVKEIDGFKFWYSGFKRAINGIGVFDQEVDGASYRVEA